MSSTTGSGGSDPRPSARAPAGGREGVPDSRWTAAWTAAPQRPGINWTPNWSEEDFTDRTVRQTVRLSAGGDALRVRLSNRYGDRPLLVTGLTVAVTAGGAAVEPGTLRDMAARGRTAFAVPPGADLATDPVAFPTAAFDRVTVTMYTAVHSVAATYHFQALHDAYRAAGDHRADTGATAFTDTSESRYFLTAVDVTAARDDGILMLGDSLVDGEGSTPGTYHRWSDLLAQRLRDAGRQRAVVNQGISGNRVTVDSPWLGDRATGRFLRDALGQPGIGTVLVLAGINDIGISEVADRSAYPLLAPFVDVPAGDVIAGHRRMIARARAAGLRTVGVTLLPMGGSVFSSPRSEAKRTAINTWLREAGSAGNAGNAGNYDAVIDLAEAMDTGGALTPAYDSGDHIHPNDTGYEAMAAATDLALL